MHSINIITLVLSAALATVGEAEHVLHARHLNFARGVNDTAASRTASSPYVPTTPTPIHSSIPQQSSGTPSSVYPSSGALSSSYYPSSVSSSSRRVSTPITPPLGTGLPGSGNSQSGGGEYASTSDLVVTYTLGTGTSTSLVTKTIHRTATDLHTVTASQAPGQSENDAPTTDGHDQQPEQTTVLQSTATETLTVVHTPTHTVTAEGADGSGACSQATVYVTKTVTANGGVTSVPSHGQSGPGADNGNENGSGNGNEQGQQSQGGQAESTTEPVVPPSPSFTNRPPYGNGTIPTSRASSSFSTRSVVPSSSAIPSSSIAPSGSMSILPFPSSTPSSTPGSNRPFPTSFRRRFF